MLISHQRYVKQLTTEQATIYERYVKDEMDITVKVTYHDLGYTEVRQHPSYPFSSLVGEVGGTLGLCLGASLLTMAELLAFLMSECSKICKWLQSICHLKLKKGNKDGKGACRAVVMDNLES